MSDRIDIPSLIFSDPHYYDGFTKRRKIRQKIVCDGILTLFRRKMTVAKSKFSSSGTKEGNPRSWGATLGLIGVVKCGPCV